ncbi:cellulase family glycosylhydrolase [Haloferula sp. BvORR071]|uniref:glycoside hydrolase family 5 protein n=1 Tax=Haloferula sp. BvORR071 TaxID=1396141 RepID=UPI000698497F|nr:cellulase family glycosylhydrolase [Haloferula sp. BvORR071]
MRAFVAFFLLLFCRLDRLAAADVRPLLPNGSFEALTSPGRADGWPADADVTIPEEAGNHFLRLKSPSPGKQVMAYQAVSLGKEVQALRLSYKVRHEDIRRGKQAWFDGRIMMNFKDAAGSVVNPSPAPPSFTGTARDWQEKTQQFRVPPGAVKLELMFTLFQAESGTLDFDEVRLVAIDPVVIDAAEAEAKAKEAARIAELPKPQPQIPVPSPDKLPPALKVSGNRLVTPAGREVWLQGLAVPSMEWSAGGENVLKSIGVGIDGWKANCIRLCLGEKFWAGTGPWQNDGGMAYRQLVEDAVNACAGRGAYIVLDLHAYRAPQAEHAAFWKDVAARYKNHPAVIFELLNEPHDISWEVWRNGGLVTDKKGGGDAVAENGEKLSGFQSIGMQGLVNVIRETGAKNLIIAGGLDWGYDLAGVLDGFALEDRGGHGIMYSSHVYPWKSDWQGKFLALADKYPLFIGEVGADTQRMEFIPTERQEDPATWVPDMLGVIQKHRLNWTAWCFHPKSTPRVLLDWDYTPTPFWGVPVKDALGGKKFETRKMR